MSFQVLSEIIDSLPPPKEEFFFLPFSRECANGKHVLLLESDIPSFKKLVGLLNKSIIHIIENERIIFLISTSDLEYSKREYFKIYDINFEYSLYLLPVNYQKECERSTTKFNLDTHDEIIFFLLFIFPVACKRLFFLEREEPKNSLKVEYTLYVSELIDTEIILILRKFSNDKKKIYLSGDRRDTIRKFFGVTL